MGSGNGCNTHSRRRHTDRGRGWPRDRFRCGHAIRFATGRLLDGPGDHRGGGRRVAAGSRPVDWSLPARCQASRRAALRQRSARHAAYNAKRSGTVLRRCAAAVYAACDVARELGALRLRQDDLVPKRTGPLAGWSTDLDHVEQSAWQAEKDGHAFLSSSIPPVVADPLSSLCQFGRRFGEYSQSVGLHSTRIFMERMSRRAHRQHSGRRGAGEQTSSKRPSSTARDAATANPPAVSP